VEYIFFLTFEAQIYKFYLFEMKSKITEKDLLTELESISEELRKYSIVDPYFKEYESEMAGLEVNKPFFVVPASFIYIISSS